MSLAARAATQDNDSHDKAVDALVNYATVKFFTNEEYELERYSGALRRFQRAAVQTQSSLNVLNTVQALIIQLAMLGRWAPAAADWRVEVTGWEVGVPGRAARDVQQGQVQPTTAPVHPHVAPSPAPPALHPPRPSMLLVAVRIRDGELKIGDFTAITVYIMQLFAPLSFLGSIYAVVVQAFVDMRNLSELLAQHPDIVDKPAAARLQLVSGRLVGRWPVGCGVTRLGVLANSEVQRGRAHERTTSHPHAAPSHASA